MRKIQPFALAHVLAAFATCVLLVLNAVLAYSVDAFGSPFLFAGSVVAEFCLLLILIYSIARALEPSWDIVLSILSSVWGGFRASRYIKRLEQTKSPLLRWLLERLDPSKTNGLLLSISIVVSLSFLGNFLTVLLAEVSRGTVSEVDARVLNLMPYIRTGAQNQFYRVITFLASPLSIGVLTVLMAGSFWVRRKWKLGAAVVGVVCFEAMIGFLVKSIVARPRPDAALAIVVEHGFSFPSGHVMAATLLYGLLAYLLYKTFVHPFQRLLIALGYVVTIGLIGISRIYLGVHYPTDVVGGIYLGASLLSLAVIGIEVYIRARPKILEKGIENTWLLAAMPIMLFFSIFAAPHFVQFVAAPPMPQRYQILPVLDTATIHELPLSSETLTGRTSEPIDFVYIGTQDQITRLFLSHGWYEADHSTIANTIRAVAVGFQGDQYLTAPVTPAYLGTEPEAVAFEKPTELNTLRQRHHTRLWRTDFNLADGQEVWVATSSFDESVELAGMLKLPTHRIAPDLDAERSYILQSLGIRNYFYLSATQATTGKNASGDVFFTDGRAAVVRL